MDARRAVLLVLDSVGIGEAPDAAEYDDQGCATFQHTAAAVGGLSLPNFQRLGLGNIPALVPGADPIQGVPPSPRPDASYGAMVEQSQGKDTITGHWELAGLLLQPGFHLFPTEASFPEDLLDDFTSRTDRPYIGNRAASGTQIIEELGEESMEKGAFILYTSADSVMQIAAHVDIIPLEELYRACEMARELCDPLRVGRVIARPFRGQPGNFKRTDDRKDFAYATEEQTLFQRLQQAGVPTYAVGKIEDIFAWRGIDHSSHTPDNESSQQAVLDFLTEMDHGFLFANFIDFDMEYGHRRDPAGYAGALRQTDQYLDRLLPALGPEDLLIITADHGNDPTFKGTDHTREVVPLLVYRPQRAGENLGLRTGFYDVAQSLSSFFGLSPHPRGSSVLSSP